MIDVREDEEQSEIEALSSKFECVKVAMTHDRHGYIIKLSIHPDNMPEDMLRDAVGTRYLMVAVRMDDGGQPVPEPITRQANKAIQIAAALCRDERFQIWLVQGEHTDEISEEAAAIYVRLYCNIKSRSELKSNAKARDRLLALRDEFADHLRRGQVSRTRPI